MFLYHPSSVQNISENIFRISYTKKNSENVFRNFLRTRGVKKKHGVGRETVLGNFGCLLDPIDVENQLF
jgi:hypothetical protein